MKCSGGSEKVYRGRWELLPVNLVFLKEKIYEKEFKN
jgi:hypothetical protein